MKITVPEFFGKFACKASQCRDSCCIGWEIDIDKQTYNKYMSVPDSFGERLKGSISSDGQPKFVLEGERCPFLNRNNLCDIILALGDNSLCEICREHPRFHEWFDGLTESGLGLCCEKTCELIFADEKPLSFITNETDSESCDNSEPYDKNLFKVLFTAREAAFSIAQNREISIYKRMAVLMAFAASLQTLIDNAAYDEIAALCVSMKNSSLYLDWLDTHAGDKNSDFSARLVALCAELEPIDKSWTDFCTEAAARANEAKQKEADFKQAFSKLEYTSEHLLVYFIYRYFLKAVFSEELISNITLGVVCVTLTELHERLSFLKNGVLGLTDVENAAHYISKEIEYSEDNLDRLADECYGGALATDGIIAFLLGI